MTRQLQHMLALHIANKDLSEILSGKSSFLSVRTAYLYGINQAIRLGAAHGAYSLTVAWVHIVRHMPNNVKFVALLH